MLVLAVDWAIVMSTPSECLQERDAVRIRVEQSPDVATECHNPRETQFGEVMENESQLALFTEHRTQNTEHQRTLALPGSKSPSRLEMRGYMVPFKARSIGPCNLMGAALASPETAEALVPAFPGFGAVLGVDGPS